MSDLNLPGEDDGVLGEHPPAESADADEHRPEPDISSTPPPPD